MKINVRRLGTYEFLIFFQLFILANSVMVKVTEIYGIENWFLNWEGNGIFLLFDRIPLFDDLYYHTNN